VTRRVLPNGLTVLVQERHTAPVVTTTIYYKVGGRDEIPGNTGLAHFLEHLMFKGTRRIGKGMVDRLTYLNGGSNNAATTSDYTYYYFNFPRSTWKVALRIEADRMRNLLLDPKEFEAERKVVMEERREGEDDPATQLEEQLRSVSFLAHPYRYPTIGWMADLRRATRSEVVEFYNRYYVPANAILVIAGDVQAPAAMHEAATAFAAVPKLPAPRRREVTEPPQTALRRVDLSLPANLPRVEMNFHVPKRGHPDLYPLEVLQYVLVPPGGKTSRLYQRLVEKEQLAADVSASVEASLDPDLFSIGLELKAGADPARAEAVTWEEIERVAREPVSERDLQKAKNQIEAAFIHERETAQDAAEELGEAEALGGYEYLLTYLDRIRAVTAADVQRVAQTYLKRHLASIGYLRPQPASTSGAGGKAGASPSRPAANLAFRALKPRYPYPRGRSSRRSSRRSPAYRGRSRRPAPAPVRPASAPLFPPLPVREERLPNGLKILLLENHDLPSVTLSAEVRAGSADDTDATAGLANFTARLLEEGTRSYKHEQISEALEFVGAGFGAGAGRNVTSASLQAMSARVRDLLPLYAEMLAAPTFPDDRVELERSRILADLQAADEDPGDVAGRMFYERVFGAHPNHRPVMGYANTVRQITPAQLREFHRRCFTPAATTLVAVGDFRTEEMLADLGRLFGSWEARPAPPRPPVAVALQDGIVRDRKTMEKAQTQILLGHLGISRRDPDFVPLLVMDTILGGSGAGFTARIPYLLRDVNGLAYSVGSSITASAMLDPGVFAASMSTEPTNEEKAIQALLAEIRRIRAEPVAEKELREAINYLVSSYVFDFQTNGQLADYLLTTETYHLGINYRQRYPALLRQVTLEQVQQVAVRHLHPDRYTLIVVGPERR
jgi:zinc protease